MSTARQYTGRGELGPYWRLNRKAPAAAPQVADIAADITVLSAVDRAVVEVNGRAFRLTKAISSSPWIRGWEMWRTQRDSTPHGWKRPPKALPRLCRRFPPARP